MSLFLALDDYASYGVEGTTTEWNWGSFSAP
jgi:hypothetical protein